MTNVRECTMILVTNKESVRTAELVCVEKGVHYEKKRELYRRRNEADWDYDA